MLLCYKEKEETAWWMEGKRVWTDGKRKNAKKGNYKEEVEKVGISLFPVPSESLVLIFLSPNISPLNDIFLAICSAKSIDFTARKHLLNTRQVKISCLSSLKSSPACQGTHWLQGPGPTAIIFPIPFPFPILAWRVLMPDVNLERT